MAVVEKTSLCADSHSFGKGRDDPLAMAIQKPKFPQYAVLSKRLESFENWPKSRLLSAEILSEAGLVYIGTGDGCRCYHCGGGLRNWEEGDDPWVEHAKWYPTCGHVKLVKGDHFINAVSIGEIPHDGQYETDVGPEDEDYLGTAAALSCLQMGFEEAEVKKAIKEFIDTNGHAGFKGMELCEIILDLEENESHGQSTAVDVTPTNAADGLELDPEKSVDELMAENEQLRDSQLCKICLENKANVIFMPCGHMVCCPICAPALTKCPVCRLPVEGYVKAVLASVKR